MPHANSHAHSPQEWADFMCATREIASPSLVVGTRRYQSGGRAPSVPPSDSVDREFGIVARRLADIVLSATSEDDLPQALDEAFSQDDFQRYCEIKMGLAFSLRDECCDPFQPLETRKALLASCYTVLAVLARDAAIADQRTLGSWLPGCLERYARAGVEATNGLPPFGSAEMHAMLARRDAREARVDELLRKAEASGQDVFWPRTECT